MLNIVSSVGYKYAGGGQGTTAAGTFGEAIRTGWVQRLFTWGYVEGSVPPEIVRLCPFIFVSKTSYRVFKYVPIVKSLSKGFRWIIDHNVFDLWVAAQIRAYDGKLDIFHGWHHQCLFSMKAAREKGAKLVIDQVSVHPAYWAEVPRQESNPYINLVIQKARQEYELADRILVPSQFVIDTFLQRGIDAAKLVLLPYGVDSVRFSPGDSKAHTDFSILFVGSVTRRKGADTLVQAFSEANIPHSRLDLVGPIEHDMKDLVRSLDDRASVHFHGQGDPLPFYRNAAVFVLPSWIEGSALVCYEAAACGVPVITTHESGSVIRDGIEGFIVPKDDPKTLADRIRLLAQNEDLRREMSYNARNRASTFTWARRGQDIMRLYRELVSGPR